MDRHTRAPPRRAVEERRLQCSRFLRPGALARLRDSRIVARSLRSAAAVSARLALPSVPPPSTPRPVSVAEQQQDGVPHFLWGPERGLRSAARYPLRRRMVAARGVVFSPPPADHGGVLS